MKLTAYIYFQITLIDNRKDIYLVLIAKICLRKNWYCTYSIMFNPCVYQLYIIYLWSVLPPFHNTCRFDFSRYILTTKYLDINIYVTPQVLISIISAKDRVKHVDLSPCST
jgi:hypothetical protein